ncbi:MAG: Ig-like domain-containing protein [Chthoniobacterales bacterium]
MKTIKCLSLVLSLFGAAAASGQTITWTAATNPHIVKGTYTVAAGQTLVMEAGVIVQIQANSTLLILGTANANGTSANHVTITGADNYSASIDAKGTLNFAFTDVKAKVVPDDNGVLLFSDCVFSSYGTVFNGTVLQATNTRAPYLQFDRCAFQGDGTYASASLYVAYATAVVRDTSFTNASYLSVSPGYLYVNNVTSDGSTQFGLDLGSDSDLFIDNVSVTNATHEGLKLSGDTRNGTNVLIGPNVTLQGNEFPIHLTLAGLYPNSNVPATGNVNNAIHVSEFAGIGGRWPKFAIPYYNDGSPLTVDSILRIDPGVTVEMAPYSYINDTGFADGMRAYGSPTDPIVFQRADPATAWYDLHSDRTQGGRMRHVIVDGSSDGVNGGNWRLENCIFQNNGIGTNGDADVSGSQYLSNGTGHYTSGNLNNATNPNSFVGNAVGVNYSDDARNVWWGSPSGPKTAANPGGTGDSIVSQLTQFNPFRTSAPSYADTPPEVELMRPSFQVYASSKVTLRWGSSDDHGIVSHKVLFSPVGNYVGSFQTIADLPATQQSYEWIVPSVVGSEDSYIKVVAVDSTGKEGFDEWKVVVPTEAVHGSVTWGMTPGQTFTPGQMIPSVYTVTNLDPYMTRVEYYLEDVRGHTRKMFGRGSNMEGLPFYSTDTARYVVSYGDTANNRTYWYGPLFKIRPDSRLGDAPPIVTLGSPAAGATFSPGAVVPISWTATDDEGIRAFDIMASFDGARTWQPVAQELPGTTTSYNWQLAPGTGSADVRVMVIAKDWRFQSSSDGASRVFSTNGGGTTTDTVSISRAIYSAAKTLLQVQASSSAGASATLTVYNTATNAVIGTLPSSGTGKFRVSSNPGNITVKSSLGGSASATVRAK